MAEWHTGDTERIELTIQEDGVNADDLTGMTVSFSMYDAAGTVVLSKATGDFTATAPTFSLDLDDDDLDGLNTGDYRYEVRASDASGNSQSGVGYVSVKELTL